MPGAHSRPAEGAAARESGTAGRRLTLSPLGFDIILGLDQAGDGLRLGALASVIGAPSSSVQTGLRVLIANDIVHRHGSDVPSYRLSDHPATSALVNTATVIGAPEHALGIILRANPAVTWAGVDAGGFLVGVAPAAPAGALERLERHLDMIAAARPTSPTVVRMPMPELERLVRVQLELRIRARRAHSIKGYVAAAHSAAAHAAAAEAARPLG